MCRRERPPRSGLRLDDRAVRRALPAVDVAALLCTSCAVPTSQLAAMDEEQKFLFDVNGYIVLEDVSQPAAAVYAPRCATPPWPLAACVQYQPYDHATRCATRCCATSRLHRDASGYSRPTVPHLGR